MALFRQNSKAKEAIKDALKTETTSRIQKGLEILEEKLKELNVTPSAEVLKKLLLAYDVLYKDELYSGIELGTINLDNLKKIVRKNASKNLIKYWELKLIGSKKETRDAPVTPEK